MEQFLVNIHHDLEKVVVEKQKAGQMEVRKKWKNFNIHTKNVTNVRFVYDFE